MAKILIVDDAVTIRMYHRTVLQEAGHEVIEAENGIEAIEKAHVDSFDLFLVDINMPKMDGYAFLTEVRQTEAIKSIPAIMISTEAEGRDRIEAFRNGSTSYLVKPVRPDILQQAVALLSGGGAS